jgi:hypothetical protein
MWPQKLNVVGDFTSGRMRAAASCVKVDSCHFHRRQQMVLCHNVLARAIGEHLSAAGGVEQSAAREFLSKQVQRLNAANLSLPRHTPPNPLPTGGQPVWQGVVECK